MLISLGQGCHEIRLLFQSHQKMLDTHQMVHIDMFCERLQSSWLIGEKGGIVNINLTFLHESIAMSLYIFAAFVGSKASATGHPPLCILIIEMRSQDAKALQVFGPKSITLILELSEQQL
jgi:hypothetical protein